MRKTIIRNPWRWLPVSVFGLFTLIGVAIATSAQTGVGSVIIGLGVAIGSIAIGIPIVRAALIIGDGFIVVRQGWSSRRILRDEVIGVEIQRDRHDVAQYPTDRPVVLTTAGEKVALTFLAQLGFGRRARRRVERYVDAIERWRFE